MGFQRDCVPLAESRGSASGGVQGAEPLITSGASQGVNPKTVRWTVFGEGTPCKRRRPLVERMIVATIIRILWDVEDAVPYIMINYDLCYQPLQYSIGSAFYLMIFPRASVNSLYIYSEPRAMSGILFSAA